MKELVIEAKVENLDRVTGFISDGLADVPAKIRQRIFLAAEEIFINIASYAYNSGTGNATIRLKTGDKIAIEFEDSGIPYNPLEKAEPDITLSADERDVGGLGVFLAKQVMDSMEYRRENGKNILLIKKDIR